MIYNDCNKLHITVQLRMMERIQKSQIFTLASGNTKKPKVKGESVTFDPGSRWTGSKVGSSVSLGIVRRCLPFSITYLHRRQHAANVLENKFGNG